MDCTFKFELSADVKISVSGERGQIIGRAQYTTTPTPSYLVRYKTGDGRATEQWWTEDALETVA